MGEQSERLQGIDISRAAITLALHLFVSCSAPFLILGVLGTTLRADRILIIGSAAQLWLLPVSCVLAFADPKRAIWKTLLIGCSWPLLVGAASIVLSNSFIRVSGDGATGILYLFAAIAIISAATCIYSALVLLILAKCRRRAACARAEGV